MSTELTEGDAGEPQAPPGAWDQKAPSKGHGYTFKDGQYIPLEPPEPEAAEPPASVPTPDLTPLKPDHQLTPLERAAAEVRRFPGLIPGAVENLAPVWAQSLGMLSTEQRASRAVELMGSPFAQRWRDPEYVAPKLPNGADPSPLRTTLTRYADRLEPGAVDKLTTLLAPDAAYKTPSALAAHVVKFLGKPEAKQYLRSQGGPPSTALPATPAKAEASRQPDGRFATPPASKPRIPSSF